MKIAPLAAVITLSLIASTTVAAQGERLRDRIAARQAARDAGTGAVGEQTISYGSDRLQTLDFTAARGVHGPAPLILFVHGGGWKRGDKDNATGSEKPAHFSGKGYNFATANYRLVPGVTVEQQAQDIADALSVLLGQAKELGIAPGKVVLMGHSAGAHLVALVGTDPQFLRKAGLSLADVAGIVPIDGAAYDVPLQMETGPRIMQKTYQQAFGSDPARQRALSPTAQATAPNTAAFLLLHVQRPDGVQQAQALETALRGAGTAVERRDFDGTGLQGHAEINRRLGDPDYPATPVVDEWLARILR